LKHHRIPGELAADQPFGPIRNYAPRRLAKGDSLLFLRALHLADQETGTTQAAIRKELGLTQPVASRFAARLKKREWLESEPSISDRRENAVRTTKKGKELLAKLEAELAAILRQYAAAAGANFEAKD
jgi:DNA-binding MarR family transcriptional regulator